VFFSASAVASVLTQFRQCAAKEQFAIVAYCFMPDHVHLLVRSSVEDADLRRFVTSAKQVTGYWFARSSRQRLWQEGFYDHVLRDQDDTIGVVGYILANPVRARLASAVGEYPFSGSDEFSIEEICACLQMWRPPVRQG
jgi:putative transposase